MAKIIDVHNHLYPKEWMDYLEKRTESPRMERTGPNSAVFYSGDVITAHIDRAGHYDVEARIADLDKYGIDTQIIGLTIPSVESVPAAEGVTWAKRVNDTFASICHKYPERFYALAALPYQAMDEATKELDRAYKDLGVKGIMMFSNINGEPLISPEFYPIYEMAEAYGLPIVIHPAIPLTADVMRKVKLPFQLYGFTLDTTMAVVSLIFQGVLEKYPRLNLVHCHLGGMAPYLVYRMDNSFRSYGKEWGIELPMTPSEYYQRQVYIDSISFYLPAMRCALDFVGADHICLGTDYAHRVGNPEKAISSVKELNLSEEDTDKILGGNAVRLFGLKVPHKRLSKEYLL